MRNPLSKGLRSKYGNNLYSLSTITLQYVYIYIIINNTFV